MTKAFKPLLALSEEVSGILDQLPYPLGMSAKLDGIRCCVKDGVAFSRKLIPLPNRQVQEQFSALTHYDGEVIAGDPFAPDVYNKTFRAVMGEHARTEDLKLYVFDHFENPDDPWQERLNKLEQQVNVVRLEQRIVTNPEEVLAYESELLEMGYEGAILRRLDGRYKFGRSTLKESFALKLKRMEDIELRVKGFIEGLTNTNEAVKDNLGHTKRSSHAEGKVPNGRVGKFVCDLNGRDVLVGTGTFTHAELKEIWENQSRFLNGMLAVRHFPHGAMYDLRSARARGWRSPIDMGEPK